MKKTLSLAAMLIITISSCGDIIGTQLIPGDENINYYVSQTTKLILPEETAKPVYVKTYHPGDADMPPEYSTLAVNVKRYKLGLGYNEMLLLDPQSAVIWPGAIIDAPSVVNGTYKPIIAGRAPLTYSISGNFLTGALSRTVQEPSLSAMRNSINDLLSQTISGSCAATLGFDIQKVDSEETATVQMGAQIGDAQNYAKANYDFTDSTVRSRFLIKFLQVYYTLDIDIPARPSDFFSSYTRYEQFGSMISENVSPVYVSSVKYGRIVLFSVESADDASAVKTALCAVLTALKTDGAIIDSDKTIVDACSIKGLILGGSSSDAAVASLSGVSGLQDYVTKGANFSLSSPGAPLAYTLRYLKNNEVARMVLYNEFCLPESAVPGEPEEPTESSLWKYYIPNIPLRPSFTYIVDGDTKTLSSDYSSRYEIYYKEDAGDFLVETSGNYYYIDSTKVDLIRMRLIIYDYYITPAPDSEYYYKKFVSDFPLSIFSGTDTSISFKIEHIPLGGYFEHYSFTYSRYIIPENININYWQIQNNSAITQMYSDFYTYVWRR